MCTFMRGGGYHTMRPLPHRAREDNTDRRESAAKRKERARKRGLDPIDDEERWLEVQEF